MPNKDREKDREVKRKYYLENRQVILERAKKWNKKHPERRREIIIAYKEKQKNENK